MPHFTPTHASERKKQREEIFFFLNVGITFKLYMISGIGYYGLQHTETSRQKHMCKLQVLPYGIFTILKSFDIK